MTHQCDVVCKSGLAILTVTHQDPTLPCPIGVLRSLELQQWSYDGKTFSYSDDAWNEAIVHAFGALHEGKAIIYDSYPDGTDIAAVIKWNAEENAYVAQNTGAWKAYFDSIGISDYIVLINAGNIRFEGEPSEPPRSN